VSMREVFKYEKAPAPEERKTIDDSVQQNKLIRFMIHLVDITESKPTQNLSYFYHFVKQ